MHITQIEEFKKCYEDFSYFTEKYVKIYHPLRGLIPYTLHDYQKRLWRTYDEQHFVIMTKFRKSGITTTSAIWAFYQCMFKLDQRIMIGCKRTSDAADIRNNIIKPVLQFLPEWMRPEFDTNNQFHMHFRDTNSDLYFHNMEACRGRRLDCLIIDEAAFHRKLEDKWKAFYPCLACGGKCFVVSTTNGIGNWFEEAYTNALNGKNRFHVFHAEHTEHPDWRDEKANESQRKAMGEKAWAQEVLQCFLIDNGYEEEPSESDSGSDCS